MIMRMVIIKKVTEIPIIIGAQQRTDTRTGGLGNKRTSGDNPN